MIGKSISHYKILDKIGAGGMGVVYKAEDSKLKRTVALKFLPPELTRDEEAKRRFLHEAQAAASLDHPNICTIHEIGATDEGQMFISMAYYKGETLKDKISSVGANNGSPLPLNEALDIAVEIAEGLHEAHQNQIVHRDIKSANIMITKKGQIKILDFGLAKLRGQTKVTKEGTTLGTVAYMSPEQASGDKVDHRSDTWSLGVLLYEMITGQIPFKGEYEQAIIYSILNEKPEPVTGLRSGIPLELEIINNKLLSKNVSDRYQNLEELIIDMKRVKKNLSSTEKEPISLKKPKPVFRKSALAAIVVIILVVLSYFLIIKKEITTKPDTRKPVKRKATTQTVWKNSIAVLPFADMSPKKDQEYFCDGMTEQIITNLSRVPDLKVIARTSVMVYKNSPKDIRQISRELGVEYILEGSVRKAGNQIRVTAQLIKAADGFHIWAQDYNRNLQNIFEIQDNVSQSITVALEGTVIRHKGKKASPYPANIQAYDWYLKGLYHIENIYLKSRSEDDFQKAVEMVNKAIELDPDWAQSYVTMTYIYENHWVVTGNPDDLKKEKEYALKACEKDPESPSANASLALQILREGNPETAFSYISKAFSINPNSSTVLHIMAMFYESIGLQDYALRFVLKTVELDPIYIYGINHLGWHYLAVGNFDQATAYFEKALKLQPEFVPCLNGYAFTLLMKNEIQDAQEILDRARPLLGKVDFHFNRIQALAYAYRGMKEAALKKSKSAIVYVALGEYEKALTFLEQIPNTAPLATTLFYSYPGLKNLLIYDPIREHPRFKAVVEKRRQHYNRLVEKYSIPGYRKKS